jgi:hypothetical protein
MFLTTTGVSAFCFVPELEISRGQLDLELKKEHLSVVTSHLSSIAPSERIIISSTSAPLYYLKGKEQQALRRALKRSVTIIDDGRLA